MNVCVIGCGGVGSWLVPVLKRLLKGGSTITVIDGDRLEHRNLDRQLFDEADVGRYKSEALASRYGVTSINRWYSRSAMPHKRSDVLIVCADNHAARNEAIEACDRYGCICIIAANETHSAEAYYYEPEWKGTRLDPRVYYPEITSDKSGDPRAASIGCTGEQQQTNPQLATANFMAAALALQLFVVWKQELPNTLKDNPEVVPHLPHKLNSTLTRLESHKAGEIK